MQFAKRDLVVAKIYCDLLLDFNFLNELKSIYSSDFFNFCSDFLIELIIQGKSKELISYLISTLLTETFERLIKKLKYKYERIISIDEQRKLYEMILTSIIAVCSIKKNLVKEFINFLNFILDYDAIEFIYNFINIFKIITNKQETLDLFYEILKKFPLKKESNNIIIGEFLLKLSEEDVIIEFIKLLDSNEFYNFYWFYTNNEKDLFGYLLEHIFYAVVRCIEDFKPAFYPIVIKEILNSRTIQETSFFKKRFRFISYCQF